MDTSSESWRFECECRHVLKLMEQGKGPAANYMELVAVMRGKQAADELKAAVIELWRQR